MLGVGNIKLTEAHASAITLKPAVLAVMSEIGNYRENPSVKTEISQ